jgi:hypothetical protein
MLLKYINEYNAETESPKRYHQWCYLGAVSAILSRNAWLKFGKQFIYPNSYIMLIGQAAARKSTAINAATAILQRSGYDTIAGGKTSKEKFLLDLSGHIDDSGIKHSPLALSDGNKQLMHDLFDMELEELGDSDEIHEILIAADEFTNFVGAGNYEFISLLGELWDCPPHFDNRVKNSKSFRIHKPCVNILAGNTPTGFAAAFPPEMLGQGFVSRLLLIFGERTATRTTWPEAPAEEISDSIAEHMARIRQEVVGEITCDRKGTAFEALDWLYKNWEPLADSRFINYSGRRFSHLLKCATLFAANALRTEIILEDVIAANTLMQITEAEMPLALGEYGRSRNSEVSNRVMELLNATAVPISLSELYPHVQCDLDKLSTLTDIVSNLVKAKKVLNTKGGFIAIKKPIQATGKYFDLSLVGGL